MATPTASHKSLYRAILGSSALRLIPSVRAAAGTSWWDAPDWSTHHSSLRRGWHDNLAWFLPTQALGCVIYML
ncbi:hypothetical protein DKP78_18080, partial [Enterococcus faecium]